MKILILEDDLDIARILSDLLTKCGHHCTHVENGALGLEQITQDDFDLIVSDLEMPGLDGLSFAVTARKAGLKAPILLFTGQPSVYLSKDHEAAITAVFDKFSMSGLIETINNMKHEKAIKFLKEDQ